ncbi:nucleotidyltransferase substrate binding protein, HI0074 family [Pseudobutyrivibrio sp. 49]|uniref:HI0074 family nucleotidyltransferase substrate-binding subunit n=1 Tax=unclassified Pseudobutyrivibrio TaxID=2638619 RepID=UPI00088E894E|nr:MULTISPECIES: HI0074 family nucleotidyltransferase substrate-binding subunit [unclassified Pseudobutyrivibrio]SDH80203.1 nucleotidyltransferase substrate binding protein, HI0074 family [Pseudobutyrivibrio sp. 49]SFO02301.1 nucleotidyltransferase substrate binding protein, HI0074 family [Pseudobutyrivibrio sp. UC1225]
MESKYFNRYQSLCKSLANLRMSRGQDKDAPFVLPATVQNFNLTFDLSWKVMKELVTQEFGLTDFASGSPRETLKSAFSVGLINDDRWMDMLRVRNTLAHDYDGQVALRYYDDIIGDYYVLIESLVMDIEKYYKE